MLIDVTRSINRARGGKLPTGIDRVCLAYLNQYSGRCQGIVWAFGCYHLLSKSSTRWLCKQLHLNDWTLSISLSLAVHLLRNLFRYPTKGDVLLQLRHSGLEHQQLGIWLKKHGIKLYPMIHDLIPITHPHFTKTVTPELHAKRVQNMIAWSTGILSNSQFTLDCLQNFAKSHVLTLPPCLAAHLPPANLPPPLNEPPILEPYFVMLGTIEARKNHALILQVWRKLIDTYGSYTPKLVIIGRRGWACEDIFDLLDNDQVFKPYVIELDHCEDSELSTWLAHARALLFPSFVEGYGIPLVEAFMLGTPVIVSDLPVFHEIAGKIPEYIDPNDFSGWLEAIVDYLNPDATKREKQRLALRQYQVPKWTSHFMQVEEFIKQT